MVSTSHSSGAWPYLRPLRRGVTARRPSLLRVSSDRGSAADSPHGCVGPSLRHFLLVVDNFSRYTTVFLLHSNGDVTEVLIDWIRAARLQLRESFGSEFPVLRLHSDRGGEFSSARLGAFCRAQGIRQTFTLPDSPQKNGIGMVMDIARTSMMHAAAPHFLWPFAVQYAAHQLNLQLWVSLPETSPALRWIGKVGDASVFWFYHPTSRRVLSSQDVTFDKSVPYYRLFPYSTAPLPPPPLFLVPGPPQVDPLPPQGHAPSGVSQVDAVEPVEVAVDSGAARKAEPAGDGSGGAEGGGAESGGVKPGGAEPRDVLLRLGVLLGLLELVLLELLAVVVLLELELLGMLTLVFLLALLLLGVLLRLLELTVLQELVLLELELLGVFALVVLLAHVLLRELELALLELEVLLALVLPLRVQPVQSQSQLQSTPPLPAPSPYTGPTEGLDELREPVSRPASPVRAARTSGRTARPRPPVVPGTHQMALHPSTAPLRVPLPSPPESSLLSLGDPESDSLRGASPSVARLLATVVTDPSFESTAASALVAELVDFPACCRLDYAASLVAESESVCPPSVEGECALSTDVLDVRHEEFQCFAAALPHLVSTLIALEGDPDAPDIPTPRSYAQAIEGPYYSQWQSAMDAEMASWKSTGTYVNEVPPPGANILSGMWIFRVKRPLGFPLVFKAPYVARGFSQRQGVDYFQTFSPTPKMTTLRVLLHIAAQRDYKLHSLDFSTAFLQGSLHEEIWLCRPPSFTGSFPPGTEWSLRRPIYSLRHALRE
ncbi:unnamed protein product [Closterium sp. NIES-64]|nr:unnamed protein product [Closterium sp. NIES-64]